MREHLYVCNGKLEGKTKFPKFHVRVAKLPYEAAVMSNEMLLVVFASHSKSISLANYVFLLEHFINTSSSCHNFDVVMTGACFEV